MIFMRACILASFALLLFGCSHADAGGGESTSAVQGDDESASRCVAGDRCGSWVEQTALLKSGKYTLMFGTTLSLHVGGDGTITGMVKGARCEFAFGGRQNGSTAAIRAFADRSVDGTLSAEGDGVIVARFASDFYEGCLGRAKWTYDSRFQLDGELDASVLGFRAVAPGPMVAIHLGCLEDWCVRFLGGGVPVSLRTLPAYMTNSPRMPDPAQHWQWVAYGQPGTEDFLEGWIDASDLLSPFASYGSVAPPGVVAK